jgi:hypothetical protein
LTLATWLGVFRNFGEEQPIMTEKAHKLLSASGARRRRPYKTSQINIRLSAFAANEQYHQMCGRTLAWPTPWDVDDEGVLFSGA